MFGLGNELLLCCDWLVVGDLDYCEDNVEDLGRDWIDFIWVSIFVEVFYEFFDVVLEIVDIKSRKVVGFGGY